MKDILQKSIEKFTNREDKFNHLREILQIFLLKMIQDTGYFKNIVFTGGTCLRILYDLQRFSEDMDFSLVFNKNYNFDKFSNTLKKQINGYGLEIDMNKKSTKTVNQINIKFKNILNEFNISQYANQKLFIRLEIDTNPPYGGKTEISLVNRVFIFPIVNFDLPSMFATKLHACFFRRYVKGRDFYDLLWYLTKRINPNFELLNNAIKQTNHSKFSEIGTDNFKDFLKHYLTKINFDIVKQDVEKFLENKNEILLLTKDNFLKLSEKI